MKRSGLLLALTLLVLGCGKSPEPVPPGPGPGPAPVPQPKPDCQPQPIANAGADKDLIYGLGLAENVILGVPAIAGQTYSWSPADSLDDASVAEPVASPLKTTTYMLTVKNNCGQASAKVTVRVYAE